MNKKVHEVRVATPDDVQGATKTLVKAFKDFAFTRHVISPENHLDRLGRFHRIFLEHIGIPYGQVWVTDDLSAVSVWTTPETVMKAGSVFADLIPEFTEIAGNRSDYYAAAEETMSLHRPEDPVWFLGSVGVDPARQGLGLGRAVIEPGITSAEKDSVPAFLETSDAGNVAYYKKLGFEVTAEYELPMNGPRTWSMLRP